MAVATKSVTGRRTLHFDTLDDILADVKRLDRGPVKSLGNWTPGQNLAHLALTMTRSLDGFSFQMAWPFRLLCKVMKPWFLRGAMPAGFQLSREGAADLDPPPTEWVDGLRELRAVIGRLKTEPQRAKSPAFGTMTREEWDRLHCRHAKLHLSFLTPM
jgi:hypothetical protein